MKNESDRNELRILAVDDEENILILIKNALNKSGFQVDTISDPKKVLDIELGQYALILLDIMMPQMDGMQLLEKIRDRTDCPVLFLTARTAEEDIVKGLGLGADDYLTKPFGIGELRARIQAHIRRENREKKHTAWIGGVQFLFQEKRVCVRKENLNLTKSEYEICEYLALHRGQVFSRERIYEHIYGFDKESDEAVITEHVKNIRHKFRTYDRNPVETVWGIGYRWKE